MIEDNIVTITKKIILSSPKPIDKEEFLKKITEFAEKLIEFLIANGCEKLGHIKFISTTDGEDYLQVSVFNLDEKPSIKGVLRKTFSKVNTTLNIIEFGVEKENISKKIDEEIADIETYFK
ncbi:MAG: hypothetical protein M1479_01585 [Actinobacteria bacterium]|nr:hypothetical protein [Cyanobacteriota bacterium]MCL5770956.1 hypothetical protein [Actinomycetota bacterium]